ncbi:hypothetical protein DM01DRAFT_1336408 [Hesseltinella vesiculosa]|uniref:Uncharacterized protein n=1 Tax=Hesseltinella vesiculosa TaxID=101127 RepID=A0A1X2GGP4_9FUNG|nr:hypothetical protein DM01DRAFT_1336408 [Hesseltinella vesiculosa]
MSSPNSALTQCTCSASVLTGGYTADVWKEITKEVKRRMFSSTGVALPVVSDLLEEYKIGTGDRCDFCKQTGKSNFQGHKSTLLDAYAFRRARSEHLVFRFSVACRAMSTAMPSIIRLSEGVFVAQHAQPISSPDSRQLAAIDFTSPSADYSVFGNQDPSTIYTFDTADINTWFLPSPAATPSTTFIPYSYTIGARYTSMKSQRDLIVRGALPFWCQALILSACNQADPPIQPNEPRHGFIPFAPDVALTFRFMDPEVDGTNEPTFLLWYERLAMEDVNHELYDIANDETVPGWQEARKKLFGQFLICNLDPQTSDALISLGNQWASQQGISL